MKTRLGNIPQKKYVIASWFRVITHRVKYIFRTRGVGSSDASRPSKARYPVLNLGTFISDGPSYASCVLEGYECQSPGNSSELPGYLDASLLPQKMTTTALSTRRLVPTSDFFPTPLDNVIPPRQFQPEETRFLRADEEPRRISKVRPSVHVLNESTRAKSRGGYLCRGGTR